jgi:LysM repeat protein
MDALGQREILRMLYEAEDQTDAAGLIMTAASAKLPGVPLQFMIGFVESITAADRTARLNVGRSQNDTAAVQPVQAGGRHTAASAAAASAAAAAAASVKPDKQRLLPDDENTSDYKPIPVGFKAGGPKPYAESRETASSPYGDDDFDDESSGSGRGRRIAFYVVIALVCVGSLFAIFKMLTSDRTKPTETTTAATTTLATTVATTTMPNGTTTQATTTQATTTLATTTTAPSGQIEHTVVAGDSLWSISKKYYGSGTQTYINLIKNANNMTSDTIYAGQTLIIPPKP